ncbi:MAG: CAP domain-containing protein, partial [Actinomycetales bacterium]|nr:CAP domain-containing protein [Actinomycetales bacterium]
MRSRALVTLALAALLAAGLVVPTASAAAPTLAGTPVLTASTTTRVSTAKKKHRLIEKYVLSEVNKARKKAGLKKLKRSAKIVKVARKWSAKQARRGELAHNPSYASQIPSGWTRASENVAWTSANST